jgi:hypothetical protein
MPPGFCPREFPWQSPQEWDGPKPLFLLEAEKSLVDVVAGEFRFHWSYFAQRDPTVVGEIIRRLRLRAVTG